MAKPDFSDVVSGSNSTERERGWWEDAPREDEDWWRSAKIERLPMTVTLPSVFTKVPDYSSVFQGDRDVGAGESALRGYAGAGERFIQLANTIGLGAGRLAEAIPGVTALEDLFGGGKRAADVFGPEIDRSRQQLSMLAPQAGERQGLPAQVAGGLASTVPDLALAFLTGGESAAAQGAIAPIQTTARAAIAREAERALASSARGTAVPAATRGVDVSQQVLEQTGGLGEAIQAGGTAGLASILTNALPASAAGNLGVRAAQGVVSNPVADYAQMALENAALPEGMQQEYTPEQALVSAIVGAPLAGALGERGPEPLGRIAPERAPAPQPVPEPAAPIVSRETPPEAAPITKPRVTLAEVQAERARRAAPIEAAPAEAAAPEVPRVERRGDVLEQQRLTELRNLRRSGELAPEQSAELLDLTERDRLSAKVTGRRIKDVQTMEARNELEATGQLKPTQAFADADNFKAVNDRLGHDVGDSVIRNMGELFANELGAGNVFHRGGDEFVLQADSPEQLDTAMARVRDTLGRATLRATLEDGRTIEQRGVGFSYGHGPTIQEAESAQSRDKEARKQAGLRYERGAAPGEQVAAEPVPIRGEAGARGAQAGEGGTGPAETVGPITAFHGTNQSFDKFDLGKSGGFDSGKLGRGVYLTTSRRWAQSYADAAHKRSGGEPNVMEVEASMKNPIRITSDRDGDLWTKLRKLSREWGVTQDPVRSADNDPNPEWSKAFADAALAHGRDGVILDIGDHQEVVAFSPESVRVKKPANEAVAPAVGTKKAATTARRALEGREPILQEAARTNQATIDKAFKTLGETPERGAEVVERLSRAGTEGISLDDEAVLLVHMSDLRQQRDAAADRIADPNSSEDAKAAATKEWGELEGRLNAAEQAANAGGREWGRFGQFRQRMLRDDFTLEALERKERARTGKPLTAKDSQVVKVYAEKIAAAQKRADAAQARMADLESETAYDSLLKSMQQALRGPRQRPTLEKLRNAANESRAALEAMGSVPSRKGQSGAVINPAELFYHYSRIGAYHVLNGATQFADWTAAMRADLGERLDAVRERLPQIFQAAKLQAERPVAAGASVDAVLAKIDRANPSPKDVRALAEAHIRAGLRGAGPVLDATAHSLGIPEADARQLFVATEKAEGPRTLDEAKQELQRLRKELQQEMSGRRQEQAQAQREAEKPTEEERFQAGRAKALRKKISGLQERIAAGDFAKPSARVPRALSAGNARAQFELTQAKEEFLRHQFEADLAKRSPLRKVFGGVGQGFNLARSIMTSLDLSGVLRQGGFITFGHPVRAAKALVPSLKAFASAKAEHAAKSEILNRPNAPLYKKYGLELTGIGGGPLSQIEEAYASRWLERIPGWAGGGLVRGSGRSYTTFLNKLRADSFDAMTAALAKGEKPTPEEGKAIANYINVATGRGKIGASENAGEVLNTVFFAPRLVASRFQLLAGQPLYGGTMRTRNLIAQDYARFMTGVGVAIALAAFMKDPEDETTLLELDPRSSDFGKLRFGKTFLDPLAGLAQVTTVASRLATGETKTEKGAKPLRTDYTLTDLRRALGEEVEPHKLSKSGELPFGSGNAADVITRFLRTKLAPVPGAIVNTLSGSNVIGEPVTPLQTAKELVTPMSFNNVLDIMEEQGVPRGSAITLLGLLGMGVQYREERKKPVKTNYAGFKKGSTKSEAPVVLAGPEGPSEMVIVGNWSKLPEPIRKQLDDGAQGVYDPEERKVYVVNGLEPAEAQWVAYHEIAGHHGLQGALGEDYEKVLNRARQNPTVSKLADALGRGPYKGQGRLRLTEEALSELAAAQRTENYQRAEEWGVKIPASAKPGLRGMLSRVVDLTKRKLSDLTGEEPDAYDDEQVHSLIEDAWQYVEKGKRKRG